MTPPLPRKLVIFSGGSAANSLVDVFNEVIENNNCSLSYVIPISDNGGSSSELIRVFGGPGIGDVRSTFFAAQGPYTFYTSFLSIVNNPTSDQFKSLVFVLLESSGRRQ